MHTNKSSIYNNVVCTTSLTDGPAWIEVITELLLGLMFKGSALSRNVANVVMATLAQHVTPSALQLIVDVRQSLRCTLD